jgi:hypothetical protein
MLYDSGPPFASLISDSNNRTGLGMALAMPEAEGERQVPYQLSAVCVFP